MVQARFFRGLSSKLYAAFFLAAVLPVAVAGAVSVFYSLDVLRRETLQHLEQEVASKATGMGHFLGQLHSELLYLSGSTTLLDLVDAQARLGVRRSNGIRTRLERDYVAFAETYPHIYQLRYLDAHGREIVRIERQGDHARVVPVQQLQDKSKRYYVQEGLQREAGEVYVSPMDLNIERDAVEQPERPVVRFATPVMDRFGAKAGLLVINLHAEYFLGEIQQLASSRGGVTYLFNRSGFYLSRSAERSAEQNPFQMRSMEDLTQIFPRPLLSRILGGAAGTEIRGDWIIAYAPVGNAVPAGFRPPGFKAEDGAEWAVGLSYPRSQLLASVFNLYILYTFLGISLLVAMVAGYRMSRHLLRPLSVLHRETEEIAKGNLSQRVEVSGADEIADLGRSFNMMARGLEHSHRALASRKEWLETEVTARTAALERQRQNLTTIIQHTADGILALNADGLIELVNDAAEKMLGQYGTGLVARHIEEFWPGWEEYVRQQGNTAPGVSRADIGAGTKTLAVSIAPVMTERSVQGYILVVRDVSEERRLQDERRELDRQAFQMEKMASMGELAMGLAHEIGNPLAGIKTVVQAMLEDEAADETLRKKLNRIEKEIDRLTGFLRSFHGFAAPQASQPRACRLEEIVEDVLFWTRKEAKSQSVAISYEQCHPELPDLWADPNQLKQVLLNLVINSVHAMPEGGNIAIRMCEGDPQWHGLRGPTGRVRLCVVDTGPGIPEDVLPRIFEPFFTTRPNGSGLGLAVVRKIVDLHGAEIRVDSRPGRGTRFELAWPVAPGVRGRSAPPARTIRIVNERR